MLFLSQLRCQHSTIRNGRFDALTSSLAALPCSLGLLRPVSATGGGLRAPLRFACAVFRACALRVLATSALRAFTFLQAFALLKMPEMTYMPSFLIRASFFRDFVNTLGALRPFGSEGALIVDKPEV